MMTGLSKTTERLGTAPLGRLILSLSLPGIVTMVTMALYNIIDTFWVARLGHEPIAALTIILPYSILVISVGVGTGVGISSLTSRRFGEGNIEATNHAAGQIFLLSGILGSIFLLVAVLFPRVTLNILGATPDIIDYGVQYLVVLGCGTPFLFFSIMGNNLLRGSGDALRPMIFMVAGTVTNIILDPFMILGIGPFPEMGVRGAALATVIAQLLSAALCFGYIIVLHKSTYRIAMRHLKPNWPVIRDIYRVGFPSMIMEMGESVMFILFNNVLSIFGSVAIAAAGISFRITDLAFMPIWGVSGGLLPIIGFNFGARLWKRLWGALKLASVGLILFSLLATIVLEIFAPQFISIFNASEELLTIAVPAMRIMVAGLFILGPLVLFTTTFQGMGKGNVALVLSLVRQFLFFVPLLYILSRVWGLTGVWISLPLADTFSFMVSGLWIYREYRRQQRSGEWSDVSNIEAEAVD